MRRTFEIALSLALLPAAATAQDMLGVSFEGSIYSVDSTTGATELVSAGIFGHNCMARDAAGGNGGPGGAR